MIKRNPRVLGPEFLKVVSAFQDHRRKTNLNLACPCGGDWIRSQEVTAPESGPACRPHVPDNLKPMMHGHGRTAFRVK